MCSPSVFRCLFSHTACREGYTGSINKAKFSSSALKILCDEIYGKYTLRQCPSFVLLPSLLLDNQSSDPLLRSCENRYYHNLPASKDRNRRRRHQTVNTLRLQAQEKGVIYSSSEVKGPPTEGKPINPRQNEATVLNEMVNTEIEVSDSCANQMLNESAADVVMRTVAAPTYFPSHQQHVDGVRVPKCYLFFARRPEVQMFQHRVCLLMTQRLPPSCWRYHRSGLVRG